MECLFCKKTINNKGSLRAHERRCKINPNKITFARSPLAGKQKGCAAWNKGLTKDTTPALARPQFIGRRFGVSLTGHTEQTRENLSKIAKERKLGGYVRGSGRGKKGWYKGFFCDSSWELAYVIYCLEHNKTIQRNTEKRKYVWQNKEKNYIPDFIVDGKLIEIKGRSTPEWEAKKAFNLDVSVLYQEDLQDVFEYVINKYGKNYIKLYKEVARLVEDTLLKSAEV